MGYGSVSIATGPTGIPAFWRYPVTQTTNFKGSPVTVSGSFVQSGQQAPAFTLVGKDLGELKLSDLGGKRKVLNIFPSIDTGVCAASVRRFNELASKLENTVVLCISADLPFAQSRFCGAEGLDNVVTLSTMRARAFHTDYGVDLADGPLAGLTARAVVVLDENDKVVHAELVGEITNEPNYDEALAPLQ